MEYTYSVSYDRGSLIAFYVIALILLGMGLFRRT